MYLIINPQVSNQFYWTPYRPPIEHLFAEQFENLHVVLTERLVGLRRPDDVGYERGPVFGPLVLENVNENHVEFGNVDFLLLHQLCVGGRLNDETNDVFLDALALRSWQSLPSRLNHIL